MVRDSLARLRREPMLLVLSAGLAGLLCWHPASLTRVPHLVDWPTLAALSGLLLLSQGLARSGYLLLLGHRLILRIRRERLLGVLLVLLSAALAAVVTNDIALFIVVPLTVGMRELSGPARGRLIVFETLAVNAGATMSPVGNPQNLFLWQVSGVSFVRFAGWMAPFGGTLLLLVLALIPLGFRDRGLAVAPRPAPASLDRCLLGFSLALYPLFVMLTDAGHAVMAAGALAALYLLLFPRVLKALDWVLLLVFALMFVDLRLLAAVPGMRGLLRAGLGLPGGVFGTGLAASQLLSNAPAAILLHSFTPDWRALAWGVNAGGYGLVSGSLANVIGLRLGSERGLWREFHRWSLPMLVGAGVTGAMLLALLR